MALEIMFSKFIVQTREFNPRPQTGSFLIELCRSKTHVLTLYFLDSGSYSKGILDWFGFFTPTEYDWIRQSQIDWFLQESGMFFIILSITLLDAVVSIH